MLFKNIKQVDEHYKYPMSHRMGSIYDEKGIIRIYSNGSKSDYQTPKFFYYVLKNDKVKERFQKNIKNNKNVRVIVKQDKGVKDLGLLKVKGFYKNFVRLEKN